MSHRERCVSCDNHEGVQQELHTLVGRIALLEGRLMSRDTTIDDLGAENAGLRSELAAAKGHVQALEKKVENLTWVSNSRKEDLGDMYTTLDTLRRNNAQLRDKLTAFEREAVRLRSDSRVTEALRKEVGDLKMDNDGLRRTSIGIQVDRENDRQRMKDMARDAAAQLDSLRNELRRMTEERDSATQRMREVLSVEDAKKSDAILRSLESTNRENARRNAELHRQLRSLKDELKEAKAERDSTTQRAQIVRREAGVEITILRRKLAQVAEERDAARKQAGELTQGLKEARGVNKQIRRRVQELQAETRKYKTGLELPCGYNLRKHLFREVSPGLFRGIPLPKISNKKRQRLHKEMYPNSGEPWTAEEERHLSCAFLLGTPVRVIAKEHGRTVKAVILRLTQLCLPVTDDDRNKIRGHHAYKCPLCGGENLTCEDECTCRGCGARLLCTECADEAEMGEPFTASGEERLYGERVTTDTPQPKAEDIYNQAMFALADDLEKNNEASPSTVKTLRFLGAHGSSGAAQFLEYLKWAVQGPPDEEGETDGEDGQESEYAGSDTECDVGGSADEGIHDVQVENAGGCGNVSYDLTDGPAGTQAPQ